MGMEEACSPPDCPSKAAVYLRMAKDPDFATIIARAREAQQHAIIDQTVDMADAATPENWQVIRLRIWARQWRAAKLAPKTYGDNQTHRHEGEVIVTTAEQRRVEIEALLRKRQLALRPTIDSAIDAKC